MTEFVATALLMVLLVLCVRSAVDRAGTVYLMALVAVLMAAVRLQYAPIALLLLGVFFLRTEKKVHLAVAAVAFLLAVGVFDAMTWDGGLFHSYVTNIRFNLIVDQGRAGCSKCVAGRPTVLKSPRLLLFAPGDSVLRCVFRTCYK